MIEKNLQEEYLEARKIHHELLSQIKELESNPEVKKYIELSVKFEIVYDKLKRIANKFIEDEQYKCDHPLWYYVGDNTDDYEQRTNWFCQCIKCGLVKSGSPKEFNDKIIVGKIKTTGEAEKPAVLYSDVQSEYKKMIASGSPIEETEKPEYIKQYLEDVMRLNRNMQRLVMKK